MQESQASKPLASSATPPRLAENFWNVPNALTLSRLGLAVVVFACVANGLVLGRPWSSSSSRP